MINTNQDTTQATEVKLPEGSVGSTEEVKVDASDAAVSLPSPTATSKKRLAMEKYFDKLYKQELARQAKATRRLKSDLKVLERNLGKENFKKLKDLMTTVVPEEKNDKGEVVKESYKEINYVGVISEGRNLIAILREERILKGQRKRTTGRSSDRRYHRSHMNFLNKRADLLKVEEIKKEVKA